MTDVPFPLLSAPGRNPQAAGGRLINTFIEQLSNTAGKRYGYFRAAGLKSFGTSTKTNYRGSLLVGGTLYAVIDDKVVTFNSGGGAGAVLGGTVPGETGVIMARNNATVPDIVIVAPGDGAFVISSGSVISYPDADVGQPNGVCFLKGVFIFTYGDGSVRNSDVDSTNINTLNRATAESKPDGLYRPIPAGNGQLLLAGSTSIEAWGGQNDTGFIFSYIATIPRGVVGPYAIGGHQDGFGKGIFLVGDDYGVHTLTGYQTTKISTSELDILIENEVDKTKISVNPFIAQGHSYVAVQSPTWCWVYDVGVQTWHERQSYLETYWRALWPVNAFGKWLCGDVKSGNLLQIDGETQDEMGDPLRQRVQTGPIGAFPDPVAVNSIELYLTKGVGIAEGSDPDQTDPSVEISMSKDGGNTWSNPRIVKVGRQALTAGRVRSSIWGQAGNQGAMWRFDMSDAVPFGLMGADMKADALK